MSTPPQPPGAKSSGPTSDDRTRDIRLPSLPDRPPAVVRPEWQSYVRPNPAQSGAAGASEPLPEMPLPEAPLPQAPLPGVVELRENALPGKARPHVPPPTAASAPPGDAPPETETVILAQPSSQSPSSRGDTLAGQPTDKLSSPSRDALAGGPTDQLSSPPRIRQQTLAFGAPAGGSQGSAASGSPFPDFAAPAPSAPRAAPVPSYPLPGTGAPSYGSPAYGARRPAPTRKRRWPWVVLILLPILVIAISGVLLFLLLGGA